MQLFDDLPATTVGWLRVAWSALLLWAWRRPRWRSWSSTRWRAVVAFGIALGAMNVCFYLAIDRLPLGTAVAIEFSGPITVAALGVRTRRNLLALLIAGVGVALLADVQWEASPLGVLFALAAASMWAGYIVLGSRIGRAGAERSSAPQLRSDRQDWSEERSEPWRAAPRSDRQDWSEERSEPSRAAPRSDQREQLDGLAASSAVGAVAIAPLGLAGLASSTGSAAVPLGAVLLCAVVGVLSNVVPYALDQFVFPRIRPSQFALLSTLLPATAAITGAVFLAQIPTPIEVVGVGLVIVAVVVRDRR